MEEEVSSLDFSERSNESLEEALLSINQHKYPANYRALLAEIAKRKGEGRWVARLTRAPAPGAPVEAEATERKYEVRELGGATEISIAAGVHPFVAIFLPIWLVAWCFAEYHQVSSLLNGQPLHWKGGGVMSPAEAHAFLAAWSIAGIVVFTVFLWSIFGKELLRISREGIELRYSLGVSVRRWFLPAAQVKGFRRAYVWRKKGRYSRGLYLALQLIGDFPRTFAVRIHEDGAADILRRLEAIGRSAGLSWKTEEAYREP